MAGFYRKDVEFAGFGVYLQGLIHTE